MAGVRRRCETLLAAFALAVLLGCLSAPLATGAKDETIFVSRQSAADGGAGGDAGSGASSISANGRYVAFASEADNLSLADNDSFRDVFVRDLLTNSTTLVSRQSREAGGAGADGLSSTSFSSISADGRFVAFDSTADNLSAADSDAGTDVFVRDLLTNSTTLVSRQSAADGGAGADGSTSNPPSISADGRFVAFESTADNLSAADNDDAIDVFVRDRETNTTTLVSRQSAADGGAGGDDDSFLAAISADGRHVGFVSAANNLSATDSDAFPFDVFIRDTQTNATTLVSRQSAVDGGAGADGNSGSLVSISADGRFVAFASDADNLSAADADVIDVFLRDTQTNTTTLVSRRSAAEGGAGAEGGSVFPSISADGRYVAFMSNADNLSSSDSDASFDVFVRDVQTNVTTFASRRSASEGGAGAAGDSAGASISADGRFVAFSSTADNLSALDADGISDVFVRDLLGPSEPAIELTAPGRKRAKVGRTTKLEVEVSSVGEVDANAVEVCAKAKARLIAIKGEECRELGNLAPEDSATTTFSVKPKRKAGGKSVKVTFTATADGVEPLEAQTALAVRNR